MEHLIGLIGHPVAHSKSPQIFGEFFQNQSLDTWSYNLWDLDIIANLNQVLALSNLRGFNVTIPHKSTIIPYLNYISDDAQSIGAVNTILCIPDNQQAIEQLLQTLNTNHGSTKKLNPLNPIRGKVLLGFNTDYAGFCESFQSISASIKQAIIIGNGGSAKAVKQCLYTNNIPFSTYSRTPIFEQSILDMSALNERIAEPKTLWINTTPAGMHPNIDQMPTIPLSGIHSSDTLIDLIYNPAETKLMRQFKEIGARAINGWPMLQSQANQAWELFQLSASIGTL
jgi:shikimate dehydrogenase